MAPLSIGVRGTSKSVPMLKRRLGMPVPSSVRVSIDTSSIASSNDENGFYASGGVYRRIAIEH